MASERTLDYQPALDGLRALAVVAVLLFHAEVPGVTGGYLGVSVFFTLSGFLITSLLLTEHDRRGTVDAGNFYARRARRLLPASLLCVAAIAIAAATTDWFVEVVDLRRDGVASILQVANWAFLFSGDSYQELFAQASGAVSPFEHFWSLSIEEQFYWIWPVAFVGLLWFGARRRGGIVAVITGVTAVFAASAPVIAVVWGGDAAYWATPARAAEILVGAWLAVVLARTGVRPRAWLAAPALIALAVACATFPAAGGPAYAGALPIVGVVSAALLFGLQADGPVRTILSTRALVYIGTISYGVYLYHWPIFVVATPERTGLDGVALFALRIGLTLAAAVVSYHVVELPIRESRRRTPRSTLAAGAVAMVAVVAFAIVLIPPSRGEYWRLSTDTARAAAIRPAAGGLDSLAPVPSTMPESTPSESTTSGSAQVSASSTPDSAGGNPDPTAPASGPAVTVTITSTLPPVPVPTRPVRIVVAGDSTAQAMGAGLVEWAVGSPELAQVELWGAAGCGFVRGGETDIGGWRPIAPQCDDYLDDLLPDEVRRTTPDVVMMMTTSWDTYDRRWPGGGELGPTDAVFAERMQRDFADISTRLLDAGASRVVWVRQPLPDVYWLSTGQPQEQPERQRALQDAMDAVAATDPRVRVVDLAEWHTATGLDTDQTARPDGLHWSTAAAAGIATDFLGGELIRAALT